VLVVFLLMSVTASCIPSPIPQFNPPIPVEENPGSHGALKSYRVGLAREATTGSVMIERQEDATYLPAFQMVRKITPVGTLPLPLGQMWLARHIYTGPCPGGRWVLTTPTYFRGVVGVIVTEEGKIPCEKSILEIRPHRFLAPSGRLWATPGLVGIPAFRETTPFVLEGERRRWELVYGGRSGNEIIIHYRLYTDDFFRPGIEQELRYDVAKDRNFVFQTLDVEIIESTHNSIVFRVMTAGGGY
jgi:hypothetical protein